MTLNKIYSQEEIKSICFRLSREVQEIDYDINLSPEIIEQLEESFGEILKEELMDVED